MTWKDGSWGDKMVGPGVTWKDGHGDDMERPQFPNCLAGDVSTQTESPV